MSLAVQLEPVGALTLYIVIGCGQHFAVPFGDAWAVVGNVEYDAIASKKSF